jgi:putative restriction endonuclease
VTSSSGYGIAFCKNAHWLFDQGLWSLTEEYKAIVAADRFDEAGPEDLLLRRSVGTKIRLPANPSYWPATAHLAWHRKHKFQGA